MARTRIGPDPACLERFHLALVNALHASRGGVDTSFTIAEIRDELVPYRSHRDVLGLEMNGDYEETLLHLLAGEGGYLVLDAEPALREIRNQVLESNPDMGCLRTFASAPVRLAAPGAAPPAAPAARNPGEAGRTVGTEAEPAAPDEESAAPGDEPGERAGGRAGAGGSRSRSAAAEAAAGSRPRARPRRKEKVAATPRAEPDSSAAVSPAFAPDTPALVAGDGAPKRSEEAAACLRCGHDLPARAGARFCPGCGGGLGAEACSGCGAPLEASWRYCVACGTRAAR